ncbi:hypothetical protein WA538_005924, partial [Blastocystis sp. DL]
MGHVAGIHVESEDPDQSSSLGLNLSSMESSPLESEDEATKTDTLLRSSDGVNYGSLSELKSLQTTLEENGMRLMVPVNPNVSREDARTEMNLVTYNAHGDTMWHPGTDGKETQWESEYLPNYRLSATWNELISIMIHYHREYQIDSFFLQDGQSWPILLESDADSIQESSRIRDASSSTEISLYNLIEGVTVLENEESGYWTCMSVLDRGYPNPFLVKIARKLNEVNENILLCSS